MIRYVEIPNCSGYYAGTDGSIMGKRKMLTQIKSKCGYLMVMTYANKHKKYCLVHRLIALSFPEICGEWFEGATVNHKNEIKTDNRPENLEWIAQGDNIRYGTGIQRRAVQHFKKIAVEYPDGTEKEYDSPKTFADEMGYDVRYIYQCLSPKNRLKTYKGLKYRYI